MPDHRFGLHPHRLSLEGDLVVQSPLHIGTGDFDTGLLGSGDTDVPDRPQGANATPGLATIQRDGRNRAYIPGSSLKGRMRRLCASDDEAKRLFGDIKQDGGGHISGVFVWGAVQTNGGHAGDAPYAAKLADRRPGAFVAARTRIDRDTGTADHNKLFFQEIVPVGARFRMRLLVVADDRETLDERLAALTPILAGMAHGVTLGKGQADGQGAVTLDPASLKVLRHGIGPDGSLGATPTPLALTTHPTTGRTVARRWQVRLHCQGPFVIVDSSHAPAGNEDERNEQRRRDRNNPALAQLKAQRITKKRPLVLGSSIMGALRTRAAWLQAVHGLGDGDDRNKVCPDAAAARALTPCERLFGVTGFRGLFALADLRVPEATPWTVTSVKLDRFSGAPFDTGLFNTAGFVGVSLRFVLVLQDRGGPAQPGDQDRALADTLVKDVACHGLMLGHGTNKGFGWFDATLDTGD